MRYNKLSIITFLCLSAWLFNSPQLIAKNKKNVKEKQASNISKKINLKWRSIGPAFTSGRIADLSVNPNNPSEYYVAAAAGHIWKTTNNGNTFKPIFDNYGAYAIGCLKIDPKNPNVVWAGTGENNHQRALGYGNGIYKTLDGGKSWQNMGLKESRQIGMIAIDPRNSQVVYVATEGSAWGSGEERGLYKTTNGGKDWEKVLYISPNTGVNNVIIDPIEPDVIYATSEQRRRRNFGKIGGGPETALYKSEDGGKNWRKLSQGLPKVHKGGMGIAIAPTNHNIIYLIIEAQDGKGGFFRSTDRGESFSKMSDHTSSGQYYNELFVDPQDENTIYSVETFSHVSRDGGRTWTRLSNNARHVDDHAMWIDPRDSQHFMIGGDGGLYETFDAGTHYLFKANLPITQFYRVAVDNSKPFYWIFGGTQDNNSMGGPNQSLYRQGIAADEWRITLGGDGFWQAIDPKDPNTVYSEYQYGNVYRYNKSTQEKLLIKPQPTKNEPTFRWNWDAPMFISPHHNTTLYMAANKVFKSTDKGNSWKTISNDLTRNEDRNQFKIMDKYWADNAVAKHVSTSQWGTIVALAESPLKAGLLYVGTDDGKISISEDDGKNWRSLSQFPNVPAYTYVSDICPSPIDENIVFATFNNHKSDDFKPYVLKSTDKGRSWQSISNNLPANGSVHCIVQDHINANLLFVGTEFSCFFSIDEGTNWHKLAKGLPDIAVKDIAIQAEENDLIIATFGRGFYILDDYSPLRQLNNDFWKQEAALFNVPTALMYHQSSAKYGQGSNVFYGENPTFGAQITYYLKEAPKTLKQQRREKEKKLFEEGTPIIQPNKATLQAEKEENTPYLCFEIKNSSGNTVQKIYKTTTTGINRVYWNLKQYGFRPVKTTTFSATKNTLNNGMPALPGLYTVSLWLNEQDSNRLIAGPVQFEAMPLSQDSFNLEAYERANTFYKEVSALYQNQLGLAAYAEESKKQLAAMRQVLHNYPQSENKMLKEAKDIQLALDAISFALQGSPAKASREEVPPEPMSLNARMSHIIWGSWSSSEGPTQSMKQNYNIVVEKLPPLLTKAEEIETRMQKLRRYLNKIDAPWTPGRLPQFHK